MKKFVSLLEAIAFFFMAFPMTALAADGAAESISLVYCIPFAGLLLCVAVLPLIKAEWWESHQPHAVVFWSLLFVIPFAIFFDFRWKPYLQMQIRKYRRRNRMQRYLPSPFHRSSSLRRHRRVRSAYLIYLRCPSARPS